MQIVTIYDGEARTTSLAISEGLEVEHRSVLQLVRSYKSDLGEFGRVAFEMQPIATAGGVQNREVAILNEQQSTLILTYIKNTEIARSFKKRLVKAFYELAKTGGYSLDTPELMMAKGLIAAQKLIEQKDATIAELAPKAAVADRIANAEGMMSLRDAAKALKLQQSKFINWLLLNGWLYRDMKGKLRGYSSKTPRYIIHKITPIPVDGEEERVSMQAMVTAEGLTKLANIFNVEVSQAA